MNDIKEKDWLRFCYDLVTQKRKLKYLKRHKKSIPNFHYETTKKHVKFLNKIIYYLSKGDYSYFYMYVK